MELEGLQYWLNHGYLQLSIKGRDDIAKYLLPCVDVKFTYEGDVLNSLPEIYGPESSTPIIEWLKQTFVQIIICFIFNSYATTSVTFDTWLPIHLQPHRQILRELPCTPEPPHL